MADQPYPHQRNDCYCCREFDADMTAHYDDLAAADLRWCQRCAGAQLTRLVSAGHIVTVGPVADSDDRPNGHTDPPCWTTNLAEEVLRNALPSASVFLRALIDEGGKATAQRLRELTGTYELRAMTLSLNTSARKLARGQLAGRRHLAIPGGDPDRPRKQVVHGYELPSQIVPIFDEALRRLGR